MKELGTPYRSWLEEDVAFIITDEERKAFLQLSTNEEREQFIEQFWQRRNPDPETSDNSFKTEHYRRIAYANEHYASGFPGWKTDRGRIYIIWGTPDQVETHPGGGTYMRTHEEGGGVTTAYPFELWRYHYMEGVGEEITLEFVDPSLSGEYHITMDPCEKDALAKIPNAAPTQAENMGFSKYYQRNDINNGGTTCGFSAAGMPANFKEFERIERFAKVQAAPPIKFKDLAALVTSRVVRENVRFDYRLDFMRVTSDTVLVPITIRVPNSQLSFKSKDDVHSAELDVYGRVTSMGGRIIQTFEDAVKRDFAESLLRQSVQGDSIYQKAVPLRPGLYRLDLVIKDVNSGNVGTNNVRLQVPRYEEDKLAFSTLIVADQIVRVASKQIGLGQFVIGDTKVRPRLDRTFSNREPIGFYLQVYNVAVDEKTHKSNVKIEYWIRRVDAQSKRGTFTATETSEQLGQTGQQITVQKLMSLASFEPGRYKIEIRVTDNIAKQTVSPTAEFVVKALPAAASN